MHDGIIALQPLLRMTCVTPAASPLVQQNGHARCHERGEWLIPDMPAQLLSRVAVKPVRQTRRRRLRAARRK